MTVVLVLVLVGLDNRFDQGMADHIGFVQFNHGNPLQTFEDLKGGTQARDHPGWQINLGQIARNNKSRRGTHPGQNILSWVGVQFCASSRITKALSKVRPRIKAKGATSMMPSSRYLESLWGGNISSRAS